MKKTFIAAIMALMILALAGCGSGSGSGSSSPPPAIVTDILSDSTLNGDILNDPGTGAFTVTQGNTQSLFAGINPVTGEEYRAFLLFSLTAVPLNAIIDSAFLDITINSIIPQRLSGTIPVRIDLVSFQPPLVVSDYDRTLQPALATTTVVPSISQADFGNHVTIDVTRLMLKAQRLGLVSFQVRILEDLGIVSPGLIEINDTTGVNRTVFAPLLTVTYF